MSRSEHLLSCLAEECCEVGQRVSKALRFGLHEIQQGQPLNNAHRIIDELNDLLSVVAILIEECILPDFPEEGGQNLIDAKRAKIERFMAISRETGALSEQSK